MVPAGTVERQAMIIWRVIGNVWAIGGDETDVWLLLIVKLLLVAILLTVAVLLLIWYVPYWIVSSVLSRAVPRPVAMTFGALAGVAVIVALNFIVDANSHTTAATQPHGSAGSATPAPPMFTGRSTTIGGVELSVVPEPNTCGGFAFGLSAQNQTSSTTDVSYQFSTDVSGGAAVSAGCYPAAVTRAGGLHVKAHQTATLGFRDMGDGPTVISLTVGRDARVIWAVAHSWSPHVLPPAGQVWFGQSFNSSTYALAAQATTFLTGENLAVVAHFSTELSTGDMFGITVDNVDFGSNRAAEAGTNSYAFMLPAGWLHGDGNHTVTFTGGGGRILATGTVTLSP